MSESYASLFRRYCTNVELLDAEADADVSVHDDDIQFDMVKHASLYLKWSRLSVIAAAQYASLDHHVNKILWREARKNARKALCSVGEKPTDSRIDEIAIGDPEYRKHVTLLLKAETIMETFKRIEYAMLHRRDMIQGLSMRQNTERRMSPGDHDGYGYYPHRNDMERMQQTAREVIQQSRSEGNNAG